MTKPAQVNLTAVAAGAPLSARDVNRTLQAQPLARMRDVTLTLLPLLMPVEQWWERAFGLVGAQVSHRARVDLPVDHEEVFADATVLDVQLYSPARVVVLVLQEAREIVRVAALSRDVVLVVPAESAEDPARLR